MMNMAALVRSLRSSLLHIEGRLLRAAGLDAPLAPALAVNGPSPLLEEPVEQQQQEEPQQQQQEEPQEEDGMLWMAVPKKRRTIEINRTRRRAEEKLIKVQNNIEPCPECGHLKQKHVLCGFCYAKVCKETSAIRQQMREMEGGPLRAPVVETVVLYDGEKQSQQDKDKRIVELSRKRPHWFSQ